MKKEKMRYRLSYFRAPQMILVCWDKLSPEITEKIPLGYYYNTRVIDSKTGEVEEKAFILLEPVKKFRKNETIISLTENVEIGLDDFDV